MTRMVAQLMAVTLLAATWSTDTTVDLAAATWQRNGIDAEAPVADGVAELPTEAMGTRWATVFDTDDGYRARLKLHWVGAPDGLLFEVIVDGARLSPPRDGWRPTERELVSDLGSVWLGPGEHLLEFVAREETTGTVRVRRLVVERLPRDG